MKLLAGHLTAAAAEVVRKSQEVGASWRIKYTVTSLNMSGCLPKDNSSDMRKALVKGITSHIKAQDD